MAINAGSVSVDLGFKLDDRQLKAYERELNKVQERTKRRDAFKAELGANFDRTAFNSYEREMKKAQHHNEDMIRANGRLRTSFGNVWSKGGAAFAAVGASVGLVTAVKSVTSAYAESQVSQEKMQTQLKALGISYADHARQIDTVIQKTSKLAGLDDEDLQGAFTNIVRATGDVNKSLKLTATAADLARAKHLDVAKAGQLLGRVANGNVTALSRYGVSIDKNATSTEALAAIQRKFAGQAAGYGRTQAGAADRAQVAWENLRETLGRKLSPAFTTVANNLADFVNGMQDGTGAGGQFAAVMGHIAHNFSEFGSNVLDDVDLIKGWGQAVTDFGGKLPFVGKKFRALNSDITDSREDLRRWRGQLKIQHEVDDISGDIDRLRDKMAGTLHGILTDTHRIMAKIKDTMGFESAEGQKQLHDNFQAAVTAIRSAMRRGDISTKTGMAQIRREMQLELKSLGISSALRGGLPLSPDPPKGNLPVTTNSAPKTKYMGGWLGGRGLIGHDTIPAMLAPGEAVLNRHQQAVIEGMLGDGFLDQLFARVNTPHFMNKGGRAMRRFARGGDASGRFLQLPESIHVTHQTAGLAGYPAEDIFASPGTSVGAPVAGTIARLSGQAGGPGGGGAFGYSIYENGANGRSYFLTHFGSTAVRPGQKVSRGDIIGTVADYPGGVPDHIHEGVHGGLTGITPGGPGGAAAAVRATWKALKAPQTALSGLLGDVVQGTLDRSTRLVNQRGRSLAKTASVDPGGSGVVGPVGGNARAIIAAGLKLAGIPATAGNIATELSLLSKENASGSATSTNPISVGGQHATGFLQMLPSTFSAYAVPGHTNITNAVDNAAASFRYQRARYGKLISFSPYARGGFARFAKGGKAKADKLKRTVGGSTAGLMRKIRPLQTDRSSTFDTIMGRVQADEDSYSQWERRFNISDEELVDSDTGQVNVAAVQRKAGELGQLLITRNTIVQELDQAAAVVKSIIASYRKVVAALRNSLKHSTRKNRAGIRSYISQYEGRIGEWEGKLGEVQGSRFDARTDVLDLQGELKSVLGTASNIQTPDTGAADTGAGAGDFTSTADTTAPPTPLQIAEGVATEMRTFLTGRQDLLSSFGGNFVPQSSAAGVFGHPDPLTAAAGLRSFGGASGGAGLGGATIINNYNQLPDNTQTWSQQMRFQVEGA